MLVRSHAQSLEFRQRAILVRVGASRRFFTPSCSDPKSRHKSPCDGQIVSVAFLPRRRTRPLVRPARSRSHRVQAPGAQTDTARQPCLPATRERPRASSSDCCGPAAQRYRYTEVSAECAPSEDTVPPITAGPLGFYRTQMIHPQVHLRIPCYDFYFL